MTIALSTDKAVNPVNLYGATKLCAEKIVSQAMAYASGTRARFASVRYGNVVGSRGSVIPIFRQQAQTGLVTITDERMTRFWITLDDAVEFVLSCISLVRGGETFVPKIPSMRVVDIAEALAPGVERRVVGIRPGEKLHEVLVTEDEARHCYDLEDRYVILPPLADVGHRAAAGPAAARRLPLLVGHERQLDRCGRAARDGRRRCRPDGGARTAPPPIPAGRPRGTLAQRARFPCGYSPRGRNPRPAR